MCVKSIQHIFKNIMLTKLMFLLVKWIAIFSMSIEETHGFIASSKSSFMTFVDYPYHQTKMSAQVGDYDDVVTSDRMLSILNIASGHIASQALYTIVKLGIPDILSAGMQTVEDIAETIGPNTQTDALLRIMRIVVTVGVIKEEQTMDRKVGFSLTETGLCLKSNEQNPHLSMSSCIIHWMERPLWTSWLELPEYIKSGENSALPFDRANGLSSDMFYSSDNGESLRHANNFVRLIHGKEIDAVLNGFDWNSLSNKRLVDIGGHHGHLISAIYKNHPCLQCFCLDLPSVISSVRDFHEGVTFVPGNIFETSTIPQCDAILMKHFLDRCMWTEDETIQILRSCHSVLPEGGKVIICEAVLPNIGTCDDSSNDNTGLFLDSLYMLVGRERQRTKDEWRHLAHQSSFRLDSVIPTSVPSCYIIVFVK